jgi:hypothetical protein
MLLQQQMVIRVSVCMIHQSDQMKVGSVLIVALQNSTCSGIRLEQKDT